MARFDELIPPADLVAALDAGHITRKAHPELPLSIYTYTRECQYGHIWTPVTMRCRGLIADDVTGTVVALPFPKIFVTAMHGVHDFAPALPAEPFEIFAKADGSLIIVFHYDGRWHAASKGSFISEQAQWAQAVLNTADLSGLDTELTYLAEAIYPTNRIVVDYGQKEDLVLLAAYRPSDGSEEPLTTVAPHWKPVGSVVRSWGLGDDIAALEELAAASTTLDGATVSGTDEEGYVIRYASGQRAKVKLSAYLTLHKLFTGTNERTIWEVLASGQDPAVLFDQVPDEFADWAHAVADQQRTEHVRIVDEAVAAYAGVMAVLPTDPDRKTFALEAVKSPHRSALFLVHDGRDQAVSDWAWKQIKPRGDKPFKNDEDN
ncbi:polynucleotide kinase [Streptomyces prunicolor]|uniref:RNA ligase n=1 Tax=Streptomyces prunicolor TaxID=67348 RepID=UPI0022525F0E|nr:RNA ligase [Streptomyces prunicolor]MCX5239744.1 polynucleotide kinase [Streptomyces prunicolor]